MFKRCANKIIYVILWCLGITAGGRYDDFGGAVDTLCLPHDPDKAPSNFPTRLQSGTTYVGYIYGSEYQFTYKNFAEDDDVPCAVCSAQKSFEVMMVPAKVTCPTGWTIQYSGFLTSEHTGSGWRPAEYLCLHGDAGYMTEGSRQHNLNGRLFYPVKAACGSLPCPPYENGQYLTCVVCSRWDCSIQKIYIVNLKTEKWSSFFIKLYGHWAVRDI